MDTLDPRKLIEMNINHMNNFHMKISRITVFYNVQTTQSIKIIKLVLLNQQNQYFLTMVAQDLGVDHVRVREQVQHHITLHNEVTF